MLWRANGARLDRGLALFDDAVRDFFHHLLEHHAQMRIFSIIGRRDVFEAVGVSGELIAFAESGALRVVGIVNSNGLASVFFSSP